MVLLRDHISFFLAYKRRDGIRRPDLGTAVITGLFPDGRMIERIVEVFLPHFKTVAEIRHNKFIFSIKKICDVLKVILTQKIEKYNVLNFCCYLKLALGLGYNNIYRDYNS